MTFSYTQISEYLACPRRYRYRYLDGWQEKELRASMAFGRALEKALAAHFLNDDCVAAFSQLWAEAQPRQLGYTRGDTWKSMLEQGRQLLDQFARDRRVAIADPAQNLQLRVMRRLGSDHDFVGYIDAVGELDGVRCLLDWKTTSSRYPAQPDGLIALDPQLTCYSWLTGIEQVGFVVFVRKRVPEIQYLRASITAGQRMEFGRMVEEVVGRISGAEFPRQGGIHFPQNHCISCPFAGFCIERPALTESRVVRISGVDLGWLDELAG